LYTLFVLSNVDMRNFLHLLFYTPHLAIVLNLLFY